MIKAFEAKARVRSHKMAEGNFYLDQIESAIMQGVAMNLLHCDWYTDANYNCTEEDIITINRIVQGLEDNFGYKAKMYVFQANEYFNNVRVKVHINWE